MWLHSAQLFVEPLLNYSCLSFSLLLSLTAHHQVLQSFATTFQCYFTATFLDPLPLDHATVTAVWPQAPLLPQVPTQTSNFFAKSLSLLHVQYTQDGHKQTSLHCARTNRYMALSCEHVQGDITPLLPQWYSHDFPDTSYYEILKIINLCY